MRKLLFFVATLAAVMLGMSSCSEDDDTLTDLDRCVDIVWDYSQTHPSGFTIDVVTLEVPKKGIVVSYEATQNSFGKEGLRKAISHSLNHCHIVGGWLNHNNSNYYFDSDTIFQESMLNEALVWAKKNKQSTIFVLSEQKEIPVD